MDNDRDMKRYIQTAKYDYYNANNRGNHTIDCVNRAISLAFGIDYNQVHKDLISQMHEYHETSWRTPYVYEQVIRDYGGSSILHPGVNPITGEMYENYSSMTLNDWVDTYASSGVYLVNTGPKGNRSSYGNHIVCVIDGTIYDSWDSSDQYVKSYYVVDNRKPLSLSSIKEHLHDLSSEAIELFRDQCRKQMEKYGFLQDGVLETYAVEIDGYAFDIPAKFKINRFGENLTFSFSVSYVFTPETTYEEAKKIISNITKIRVYDRFYEINKKLKSKQEGYELFKQSGRDKNSSYEPGYWWNGNEKRFYNSLPGWVKPFIKCLNVDSPGQYLESYRLHIYPIPGDTNNDIVKFFGETSQMISEELSMYKKDFSRPGKDYPVSDLI